MLDCRTELEISARMSDTRERRPEGMLPVWQLEELSRDPETGVRREKTRLHLALSPGALGGGLRQGLECVMMENLNRYDPQVGAILLGWDKLKLKTRRGDIVGDSPYIHVDVEGWTFLFSPEVGAKIVGKVIKKISGHLGCLVYETFNVSLFCDKNQFNTIQLDETVRIRVTSLTWDNRRRPFLHGRLDLVGQTETEYDSGIDSTINGHQGVEPDTQTSHHNSPDDSTSSNVTTKTKKGKKRKREAEESLEVSSLETSSEVGGPAKKKKKKKKLESE